MATVNWGHRQPGDVNIEPVAVQPWTDTTGKPPQTRVNPTAPTAQPYGGLTRETPPPSDAWPTRPPAPIQTPVQAPAAAPAFNGDYQGYVTSLTNGKPASSETLQSLAPQLQQAGISLEPANAAGFVSKIRFPDGRVVRVGNYFDGGGTPSWGWVEQPGAGSGGGGGSDPNAELYFNELLARMNQLRQGVNDPFAALAQLMGLERINSLQGAPFTGAEDAALTARYMNPLTQARDQQLQQNKEQIGAHGMLPTSGLLQELNKGTDKNYQQGVALGANDLGVRAVQEKQARQDQALQVLSDLLTQGRNARTENNQQANELINLASQFPAFDERRLGQLIQASGDTSAASGVSALVQQQSTQLLDQYRRATTKAEQQALLGQYINLVINNLGKVWA